MRVRMVATFVIGIVTVALGTGPMAAPPQLDTITDADAYAIYALLLPGAWATRAKGTLLLQQETEGSTHCPSAAPSDPEWAEVAANFKQENTRVRRLEPVLPVNIPYRLISKAEIEADDARLALKYPGTWQRRPESMEYAAVSVVGFNRTRTKAMVYVRLRSRGNVTQLEKREGQWVNAKLAGCGWIA